MDNLTLKQAALLLARFFGFYLLFYAALGLTEFPSYWLRSSYSQYHSLLHTSFDASFDIALMMYCAREVIHVLAGIYLLEQPGWLATRLMKRFGNHP